MKQLTFKQKQAAAHKHFAEQFPLLDAEGLTPGWVEKPKSFKRNGKLVVPQHKMGRPKTGWSEFRLWVSPSCRAYLEMMEKDHAIRPGVLVEMMIAVTQDAATQVAMRKRS